MKIYLFYIGILRNNRLCILIGRNSILKKPNTLNIWYKIINGSYEKRSTAKKKEIFPHSKKSRYAFCKEHTYEITTKKIKKIQFN